MTELGSRLKEAREAKGLSLDDVQNTTKIQKRYLKGIEEGNYDSMPGKFYVRAFIKQYAEAVGIEPEPLFEEYKADIPEAVYHEELPDQVISRVQSRKSVSNHSMKVFNVLPTILIVVFIVAAVFLGWYLIQRASSNHAEKLQQDNSQQDVKLQETGKTSSQKNQTANTSKQPKSTSKKPESKPKKQTDSAQVLSAAGTTGNTTNYKLSNADKFNVTMKATGKTWVQFKNGKGNSLFQGLLTNGKSQTEDFTKETEAVLTIGDTTHTDVYVNGKKLTYKIPPNQQVNQNLIIQFQPSKTK